MGDQWLWRKGCEGFGIRGKRGLGWLDGILMVFFARAWGWTCSCWRRSVGFAGYGHLYSLLSDCLGIVIPGYSFSLFFLFSFSSAVESGVGMLLWGFGSWETERCVSWGVGWTWLVFVMLGGV